MKTIETPSGFKLEVLHFEVDETPYVIPDEKSYRHTKKTVEGLTRGIEDYRARGGSSTLDPKMKQMVIDGTQSLIDEWSEQMREYERLKSGHATLELHSLGELPTILIKARVAAGLTQKQLAQKLGLAPQQIQRYEATRYRTITLARMQEIAQALGVRVKGEIEVGQVA